MLALLRGNADAAPAAPVSELNRKARAVIKILLFSWAAEDEDVVDDDDDAEGNAICIKVSGLIQI